MSQGFFRIIKGVDLVPPPSRPVLNVIVTSGSSSTRRILLLPAEVFVDNVDEEGIDEVSSCIFTSVSIQMLDQDK